MFVANLDADRQGIHGFRIMINEDNSLDMIPVWSFSSSNANIIHLATKSTEEVVHSQGRVMADRSVLFKYLNPNLAFVLAEGKESSNGKSFINVYLLDLVTGRIIFGANHKRVQGKKNATSEKKILLICIMAAHFDLKCCVCFIRRAISRSSF